MQEEKRPRNPKTVVLEAELLASSPESVRDWLKESAKERTSALWMRKEEIDQVLLARSDPLVTLSLAQYSQSSRVVQAILAGPARANKAVRLAALMNEAVARAAFGFPAALVEDRQVERFLSELDAEEILALFSNSELSDSFLRDFFEQKGPWQALDEEGRFTAIAALSRNTTLLHPYEGAYDGWAEHNRNSVFEAAWALAAKVPVTDKWAAHLGLLYGELLPGAYSIVKPLELAARWIPDPSDTEQVGSEKKDLEQGRLGIFAMVRKYLARLALSRTYSREDRRAFFNHEDPAVRAAYYASADLTVDDIRAADERDPFLSFEELVWNDAVWRTKAQRQLLHDMAWDAKRDPKSYMDPQNMFKARLEYYQGAHPEWFKDEEDQIPEESDTGEQPGAGVSVGDAMEDVKGQLLAGNDLARATHIVLVKLLKRSAWIGWGIALVLALLVFRGR